MGVDLGLCRILFFGLVWSLAVVLLLLFEFVVLFVVCLCLEVVLFGLNAHGRALGPSGGEKKKKKNARKTSLQINTARLVRDFSVSVGLTT